MESVTDGVGTTIITSTGSVTNGLTDIGFQIRVTRNAASGWTLYSSILPTVNGSGALATDVLNSTSTSVLQGSVTDATYTTFDNGYLGVAATHSTGGNAIIGQEFDNFKFDVSETATLPINLTSFTGKPVNQSILLNWETASETNNDYFEVFKSSNGKTFTSVGTVKGSGTSKDAKIYSLVDENPAAGANYYQLVQHDFDGKSSKSEIISVNAAIANSTLSVYAAASAVNVSINSANQTDGTLQFFDLAGKKLNETRLTLNKGFNTTTVPLSLNSGIYVVSFVSESEVINSKFIKD